MKKIAWNWNNFGYPFHMEHTFHSCWKTFLHNFTSGLNDSHKSNWSNKLKLHSKVLWFDSFWNSIVWIKKLTAIFWMEGFFFLFKLTNERRKILHLISHIHFFRHKNWSQKRNFCECSQLYSSQLKFEQLRMICSIHKQMPILKDNLKREMFFLYMLKSVWICSPWEWRVWQKL